MADGQFRCFFESIWQVDSVFPPRVFTQLNVASTSTSRGRSSCLDAHSRPSIKSLLPLVPGGDLSLRHATGYVTFCLHFVQTWPVISPPCNALKTLLHFTRSTARTMASPTSPCMFKHSIGYIFTSPLHLFVSHMQKCVFRGIPGLPQWVCISKVSVPEHVPGDRLRR